MQKLTMEYTEHAKRVKFMSKRIIFCHSAHLSSLCDLRGLCGEKIAFWQ